MFNNNIKLSDFKEKEEIGNGKNAKVFKGKYLDNLYYSIKEIQIDDINEQQIKNLQREISILDNLKNVSNQNIMKYYTNFQENNNIYLVLEYINGENLDNLLEKYKFMNQYFDQTFIFFILKGVINGLFFLHSNCIMHRDISPDNIMIDYNNYNIKITDFGLSVYFNDSKGTKVGKKMYICPEILDLSDKYHHQDINNDKIKTYNYKLDIYSLGVTMFYLMTFELPFISEKRIRTKAFIDQNRYNQKLIDLVMKMLEEENNRPNTNDIYNVAKSINFNNQDIKKIIINNINLKKNYIIKKTSFFSTIYCLCKISLISEYFKKDLINKKLENVKKKLYNLTIVIDSFIEMINKLREEKNEQFTKNSVLKFVETCSVKIEPFKQNLNFSPQIIIKYLFTYFFYNITNIFVYNNIMAFQILSLIKEKKNNNQTIDSLIEQKANEFKEKYSSIFGHTFYFIKLIKIECPNCKTIIEENANIDYEIIFHKSGEINQLFAPLEILNYYDNDGKNCRICPNCGLLPSIFNQIETIYTAPNVLIIHFNNSCKIKENLEIIEKINPNKKINYILKSLIIKEINNNNYKYNASIRNISKNSWIYYSEEYSQDITFEDIFKKGNICTAFYQRENIIN